MGFINIHNFYLRSAEYAKFVLGLLSDFLEIVVDLLSVLQLQ